VTNELLLLRLDDWHSRSYLLEPFPCQNLQGNKDVIRRWRAGTACGGEWTPGRAAGDGGKGSLIFLYVALAPLVRKSQNFCKDRTHMRRRVIFEPIHNQSSSG
jgi:hypothetical protein